MVKVKVVSSKSMEVIIESTGEYLLQFYIILWKTGGDIMKVWPELLKDFEEEGFLNSTLSAMLSSYLTFLSFAGFHKFFFIVNDQLHIQSSTIPFTEYLKRFLAGIIWGVARTISITLTSTHSIVIPLVNLILHFWMFSFELRKMFGKEEFLKINIYAYAAFFGFFVPYNPKSNFNIFICIGSSLLHSISLLLVIDPISFFTKDSNTSEHFRYFVISAFVLFLASPVMMKYFLDGFKQTNFGWACVSGDMKSLKQMAKAKKVDFNEIDLFERTGFILACEYGNVKVVKYLLENAKELDIDLNYQALDDLTGFHIAAIRHHYDILSLIMKHSDDLEIDLNLKDFEGQTGFEMWPGAFKLIDGQQVLKPLEIHTI